MGVTTGEFPLILQSFDLTHCQGLLNLNACFHWRQGLWESQNSIDNMKLIHLHRVQCKWASFRKHTHRHFITYRVGTTQCRITSKTQKPKPKECIMNGNKERLTKQQSQASSSFPRHFTNHHQKLIVSKHLFNNPDFLTILERKKKYGSMCFNGITIYLMKTEQEVEIKFKSYQTPTLEHMYCKATISCKPTLTYSLFSI